MYTGGFPGGSDDKESACNAKDLGTILVSGRSPGEGNGYLLQYSCLENSVDRGAWWPRYSPWSFRGSDTTEPPTPSLSLFNLYFDLSFLQPNRAEIHFAKLFTGKNRKFPVLLGNQNIYEMINGK